MGALGYLRRWWELNAAFFGRLHRIADAVAGLAFVGMLVLGGLVYHEQLGLSIPIGDGTQMSLFYAMLAAVGVFIASVLVQTLSALRAFFARVRIRIIDFVSER